ncbi:MAG: 50S ribosomal protein L15 [Candidatus Komeilibacteria bacterium]
MLGLHTLKKHPHSTHRKKRLGRGNASGHGSYSTRGQKGQRSRSGGKGGLKLKGIRGYLLRIPKTRGFKSSALRPVAISLNQLVAAFEAKEVITIKKLIDRGFISGASRVPIKIIGNTPIVKVLTVKTHFITPAAKAAIEAAGGSVEILVWKQAKPAAKEAVVNQQ